MLNQVKMIASQTAENGIVNSDTVFYFEQNGELVSASYAGGKIRQGYLVGRLTGAILEFSYCQYRTSGEMDHGDSKCSVAMENGRVRIEEQFEMTTDAGVEVGVNVFTQV